MKTLPSGAITILALAAGCLPAADLVPIAPGGTVRIVGSHGDLNIQGWDRPEVELVGIHTADVKMERRSNTEIEITTSLPPRSWKRLGRRKWPSNFEYQIHVPRDSRVLVQHGTGTVAIANVRGEVQAHVHMGDIVLLVPGNEPYAVDAKVKMGSIDSDLGSGAASGRRLILRVGIGGITIKSANPKATRALPAPLSRAGSASAPRS